ncbi:MAG: sulfide:quinone reductase, partial [Dehalococcoidia bacterium]|nr:sulfide:quinone reductase [Dehalococcoidia bacterium]
MRVVIIGGSFGGMTTAYQLRRRLAPGKCEIRLISRERRFVFVPSLPWVVMGSKTLNQISFDLEKPLARKKIDFFHSTVLRV